MSDDEYRSIKLVKEVKKYPCLYNTNLPSYSRRSETDQAWEEIGKTMNMKGPLCKEKFRNLRVVFMRHLKPTPSGSGTKRKKPYYLHDYMQFLTPYIKSMNPPEAGNLPLTSSIENTETMSATTDESNDVPIKSERCDTPPSTHDDPAEHSSKPKRKKPSTQETETYFIDYLKQDSTRESQTSMDAVMSFLNSLAPELKEMNLQQFKAFKRRVLSLIDDILDTSSS